MSNEPFFPHPQDKYPVVYLEETDVELPEHVVNVGLRYTHFQQVATGGKCVIQSCKDYHLSRTVAHKSLLPQFADDPFERKRFLREARVTAMLQHPNTIPVYDLSRDNRGHYFFTMKLVEGYTLREILDMGKADGTAPVDGYGFHRMVTILIQIGNCLDYAHTHGVVHRDIKPPNILTGPFGEVMLLDWGLAKVWNEAPTPVPDLPLLFSKDPSLTAQGRLQGTLHYMSPEQVETSPKLDHRTDIYSMGVILYEILSGGPMLKGDDLQDLIHQVKNVTPPRPSSFATDRQIPKQLEDICMRCIAKDPDERIQTARRLVSALRSWRLRWSSESR
jgi:serine/threonine protein kinase